MVCHRLPTDALRGFAQERLVLGESLSIGFRSGLSERQINELRRSGSDRLGVFYAGHFVAAQIIKQFNVAGRQRRRQHICSM